MIDTARLEATVGALTDPGKGILAADESVPTITRRLQAVGVESTPETRRAWRGLLFGTPGIGEHLAGVILFEETLDQQADDGTPLVELLARQGIVPGIKVDKGTELLPNACPGEKVARGLDGLAERLAAYREKGARFTKWRDVYLVGPGMPSPLALSANAEVLARYAALAQQAGFVPIVEPEVLMDGDHGIEQCAEATEAVLHAVYHALHRHRVVLELTLLKPNMVVPGKAHPAKVPPEMVAEWTLRVLRRAVPAAVPGIFFLSGGQSAEEADANLAAINRLKGDAPWTLSFSFARALQQPAMEAWRGQAENVAEAQRIFLKRCRLTAAARRGEYTPEMEAAA